MDFRTPWVETPYVATRFTEICTANCPGAAVKICAPAQNHRYSDRESEERSRNREDGSRVESRDCRHISDRRWLGHRDSYGSGTFRHWTRDRRRCARAGQSATSRLSFVSTARYTCPIPPCPSLPRDAVVRNGLGTHLLPGYASYDFPWPKWRTWWRAEVRERERYPVELDLAKNETDSKRLARSRTATYKFLVSESATAGSTEALSTGPLQPRQASTATDPPHGITQPAYMCRLWEQPGRG
jgi:hypothetical protein